jgi:hypothetical protein
MAASEPTSMERQVLVRVKSQEWPLEVHRRSVQKFDEVESVPLIRKLPE